MALIYDVTGIIKSKKSCSHFEGTLYYYHDSRHESWRNKKKKRNFHRRIWYVPLFWTKVQCFKARLLSFFQRFYFDVSEVIVVRTSCWWRKLVSTKSKFGKKQLVQGGSHLLIMVLNLNLNPTWTQPEPDLNSTWTRPELNLNSTRTLPPKILPIYCI